MSNSGSSTAMEAVQSAALEKAAGIKLRQVGFDKPAERYGALLGGHVDSMFEQPGDVKQFITANQMKPILTLLPKRPAEFSNVPAMSDAGLSTIPDLQRVRMFWVHKDVPEARRQYLRNACELAYKNDKYAKFNESMFMHIGRSYYNSADSLAYVNSMIESFKAAYKEMGIIK
jgi:tripartite-type tricarboxylate transporter receptor subunit TctC